MKKLSFWALCLTLIFVTSHAYSQTEIIINDQEVNLTDFKSSYFIDHSHQLTFSEVKNEPFTDSSNRYSLGTQAKTTWVKLHLKNNSPTTRTLYLHIPHAYHNRAMAFYEETQGDLLRAEHLDMENARNSKLMYRGTAIYEFELKSQQSKVIYVQSASYSHQWFTMQILDKDFSKRAIANTHNDIALLVGILLALMFYNLILHFSSRTRENLFYSLYLLSGAIWISLAYGLLANLFDIYGDGIFKLNLALITMPAFLMLFMINVFETKKQYPTEHKILLVMLGLIALTFIYGIFDISGALKPASSLAALVMIVTLSITLSLLKKGNPLAKFFLLGHALFVIFNAIAVLFYKGMIDFTYISSHGVGIGIMLEALMMAFIISYRIKMLETEQQELRLQAIMDPLTKLYNRRYFFTQADFLLKQLKEKKHALSLAILDIDDFKSINDNYGHKVGDEVLVKLASKLQEISGSEDIIARFGGEEFVVLFPYLDAERATKAANDLKSAVTAIEIKYQQTLITFSISIGVTQINSRGESIEEAIERADQALYQAKRHGKNCVRSA